MKYKDYYKILGLKRGVDEKEMKKAYRRLARKYHPDVSKEPRAEERFKAVQEAYAVLKDPEKRRAYDQLGANWQAGQEFRAPPGWQTPRHGFGQAAGGADPFSDFFSSLFGGGTANGGRRPRQQRSEPVTVRISLEEAFAGTERNLRLSSPNGGPARTLKVRIPAGVIAGQQIRLPGQGGGGIGRSGDLFLKIELNPHPLFRVENRDIHLQLPVTPWEAALGAKIQVPTLKGAVQLSIPAASNGGSRLRLKGRGLGGERAGSQYVSLEIKIPPADTEAAREAYRQFAEKLPFNPRTNIK